MAGNSIGVNVVSVVFDKTKLAFMKWLFSAYLRQSKLLNFIIWYKNWLIWNVTHLLIQYQKLSFSGRKRPFLTKFYNIGSI